ncbi:MAG: hypothetical protein LC667_05910 [Thioalkalivibrio sp.]|nr:hypothetical protein [Thioalkalivibrio sp.]
MAGKREPGQGFQIGHEDIPGVGVGIQPQGAGQRPQHLRADIHRCDTGQRRLGGKVDVPHHGGAIGIALQPAALHAEREVGDLQLPGREYRVLQAQLAGTLEDQVVQGQAPDSAGVQRTDVELATKQRKQGEFQRGTFRSDGDREFVIFPCQVEPLDLPAAGLLAAAVFPGDFDPFELREPLRQPWTVEQPVAAREPDKHQHRQPGQQRQGQARTGAGRLIGHGLLMDSLHFFNDPS